MSIPPIFSQRRSIRRFDRRPVEDRLILEVVSAARLAPTARNIQPWEFIVVKDPASLQRLGACASPNGTFITTAAACLVVFCKDTKYYLEDGCAATTQALLCAASLGLGACWIAGDKKEYAEDVRRLLSVPEGYKLVSLIPLGYPDEKPSPDKRDLDDMLHMEKFA